MDVGMMMVFASYGWENIGDDRRRSGWRVEPTHVLEHAIHAALLCQQLPL